MEEDYEYFNEDSIDESLKCMNVCHRPLINPVIHPPCEATFCASHIPNFPNNKCPQCNAPIETTTSPFRLFINLLDNLKIVCPHCQSTLTRGYYPLHLKYECPISCPNNGCTEKCFRAELDVHRGACLKEVIQCNNHPCEKMFERLQRTQHEEECEYHIIGCPNECESGNLLKRGEVESHLVLCPRKVIICPLQCGAYFEQQKYEEHKNDCPLETIPCPAHVVLCPYVASRETISSHIEFCPYVKLQPVLLMLIQNVTSLEQEVKSLEQEVKSLKVAPLDGSRIIPGSVTSDKIVDGSISSAKIANNAITTAKIVNNAVTTSKIANKAVTTARIVDNAVTTAKIVDNAVTTAKLVDNAVTSAKMGIL